jgi:serine/threonine protein kinase
MTDSDPGSFFDKHAKTLEVFLIALHESGLDGPVDLLSPPEKIGEGGQFYVYKQTMQLLPEGEQHLNMSVAVKRPKFPENLTTKLDLAKPDVRSNLYHVYLEIKALTDNRVRRHPNVVKLLAWAIEDYNWNAPFVLVFELAFSDLEKFLECEGKNLPFLMRSLLCEDVAAGLDVIHDSGFVHGDLKPANVLLFHEDRRVVAKLADFGFAAEKHAGGTAGWEAPEKISSREADRFSYGLLMWSVLLHSGKQPPTSPGESAQSLATRDLENNEVVEERMSTVLRGAFHKLLQREPQNRPRFVSGLLDNVIGAMTDRYVLKKSCTIPNC